VLGKYEITNSQSFDTAAIGDARLIEIVMRVMAAVFRASQEDN